MSFVQFLYQLFIAPLELIFECIYSLAYGILGNIGLSIIPMSLAMNFLLLPFYNRADQIQKEEHDREAKLAPGIAHLKKTFDGDKRFMLLQTYYRQNHYSPLYTLRSSFAVILEIPFFIAAYHFLSNYKMMSGVSFGFLKDLGKPDHLLTIAGFSINVMPILMTLINIISSKIYSKNLSRKDEIRMYAMALFFLVLLYRSPSGLVFYWTCNQIFSLMKNVVYGARDKHQALTIVLSIMSVITAIYGTVFFHGILRDRACILLVACVFLLPVMRRRTPSTERSGKKEKTSAAVLPYTKVFLFSALFLSALIGLLIPSSVIHSSPSEFIIFTEYQSPVRYVLLTLTLSLGLFVVWGGLFYYLSKEKARRISALAMCILSVCGLFNYLLFGKRLPFLRSSLIFDGGFTFPLSEILLDLLTITVLIALIVLVWRKRTKILSFSLLVLALSAGGFGIYNTVRISQAMPGIKTALDRCIGRKASFSLSKEGNNVIVIMLDRAMSCYVPYLMQEDPNLEALFDGFTWYPNTLSFGATTNIGTPPLFGGYEYQPVLMNARDDLSLSEKQNEALRLMPVLFSEEGYDVTVCDPPYAGYTSPPDLSIYDDHPNIHAYSTEYGQYWDHPENHDYTKHIWSRNFFCYGWTRIMPLCIQSVFYDYGKYYDPNWITSSIYHTQFLTSATTSIGMPSDFMNAYTFLDQLPETTQISDGNGNTFLMMNNLTAHDVAMLQEPEYVPAMSVDNTEYDATHEDRFTVDGRTIAMPTDYELSHYQSNMAALKELGQWFDYMRREGVYDNTRIIIVSDHGFMIDHFDDLVFGHNYEGQFPFNCENVLAFNAFFMVKDFNSTGFTVDYSFMTNADTPTLAFEGLIENPVNPATGNPVNSDAKNEETLHVMYTLDWRPGSNNGNTFSEGIWFGVHHQNIFDISNWEDEGKK